VYKRLIGSLFIVSMIGACSVVPEPDVVRGPAADQSPASAKSAGQGAKSTAATLGIPPGHLPPPGSCRIWEPGRPPGHQEAPGDCDTLARRVDRGEWLVYRPGRDKKYVEVRVYDGPRTGVTLVRLFDILTGELLEEREVGPTR